VQLVLEYCDKGCLREALDAGIFFGQAGLNFAAILDTAADVAKALLHLHLNDVLHGDLKADNVMLKSCGGEGRGIVAKVADFGLAIKMDHQKTHVSATFQGTLTHMAPGVVTRADMFTGGMPYKGVPGALLGHLISMEGKRPVFPPGTPPGFKTLAERCWHADLAARPGFEEILTTLTALRAAEVSPTPALSYTAMTPEQRQAVKTGPATRLNVSDPLGAGVRTRDVAAVDPEAGQMTRWSLFRKRDSRVIRTRPRKKLSAPNQARAQLSRCRDSPSSPLHYVAYITNILIRNQKLCI
ncbi:hypothetical protein VOLCADRAFT_95094, partial [Volvox carteri f. nagariensis]